MKTTVLILAAPLMLALGCAGPSQTHAAEPVSLAPAVWAPKRIYAPLNGLTRSGAERVLTAEARKDCGGEFESRAFESRARTVEPGTEPVLVLAIEYVCVSSTDEQSREAGAGSGILLQ
jgi:hypothetical protein